MPTRNLHEELASSLHARILRLLARPLIGEVGSTPPTPSPSDAPGFFFALDNAMADSPSEHRRMWRENPEDGTCEVDIRVDYRDRWNGQEKEVLDTARNAVESPVALLTAEQLALLMREPAKFLALNPPPESAVLLDVHTENFGGRNRVVGLRLASAPRCRMIKAVAVIPNLIPLLRQQESLKWVANSAPGSAIAPLRALIGLDPSTDLLAATDQADVTSLSVLLAGERLDEDQRACVAKALSTPHFSVIHGPPGAGKTTVISSIIRRYTAEGKKVLVVSPTHVAVDNVVEKLVQAGDDAADMLAPDSIPVRYAARETKLAPIAKGYFVNRKRNLRAATIASRLTKVLQRACSGLTAPKVGDPNTREDDPHPSLTRCIAETRRVFCGTPIGLLSCDEVKDAALGQFDVLIIDEVSKMTIPEFLAIAVKAKRWVMVGDPMQLPPFMDSADAGVALDDVLEPELELVLTLAAMLEKAKPTERSRIKIVAEALRPDRVASALREHLCALRVENCPSVTVFDRDSRSGILLCAPGTGSEARDALLATSRRFDAGTTIASYIEKVHLLVERGLRPIEARDIDGAVVVTERDRMPARLMEVCFHLFHGLPWGRRAGVSLPIKGRRNGIEKFLPSVEALAVLRGVDRPSAASELEQLHDSITALYALQCLSVFDWMTLLDGSAFDFAPLDRLQALLGTAVATATTKFTGVLRKQYRMDSSISAVPREIFYFGQALIDGKSSPSSGARVRLVQVVGSRDDIPETNTAEFERIETLLRAALAQPPAEKKRGKESVMLITPYRKQRELLEQVAERLRREQGAEHVEIEVSTLDSCQGREADYVFISLVSDRASAFLDNPKRWNVALTRAREGLFIVGNLEAYAHEAHGARREALQRSRAEKAQGFTAVPPRMSVIALALEHYARQRAR